VNFLGYPIPGGTKIDWGFFLFFFSLLQVVEIMHGRALILAGKGKKERKTPYHRSRPPAGA